MWSSYMFKVYVYVFYFSLESSPEDTDEVNDGTILCLYFIMS